MAIKIDRDSLYTIKEISELFDIQERTIRAYIREGKLKGQKLATRWYVSGKSLLSYFEEGYLLENSNKQQN